MLEISYSHSFPKENISIEEAQFMLYTIMEKTEKTIKIQNFIDERYKAIIKASEEKDIKLYHKLKIDQNIILKLKKLRTDLL